MDVVFRLHNFCLIIFWGFYIKSVDFPVGRFNDYGAGGKDCGWF